MSVAVADSSGVPVASVESLVVRPLSAGQLQAADRDTLFTVDWTGIHPTGDPVESLAVLGKNAEGILDGLPLQSHTDLDDLAEAGPHGTVLVAAPAGTADPTGMVESVHAATVWALGVMQSWLAEDRFAASRLVFVTRGAVS
ncbi:hypothetical protein, partial [Streptomyces sp. YGL11-2]|uniref:hypothetical protein n=1 Tax=Streptomyces sp. YGL11-2 TaxID=3414028 RepID=UPI003CEDF0BF